MQNTPLDSMNPYLKVNLDDLIQRVELNKASLIIIDGGVGEGKTTLAVQVADYIQGKEIDFNTQYGIGGEQFQEKLINAQEEGLKVVIYDEAGDFNTRGSLTKFNLQLNRVFETFRAFRVIVVLVLPSFNSIDRSLLDKQIPRLLLHCQKRTKINGNYKGFSLVKMFFIKQALGKLPVPSFAYTTQTPNFIGSYKDISPERSQALEKISIEGKKDIINSSVLKHKGLMSVKDIKNKLNMSEIWIKKKLKALGEKHQLKYNRANYYSGNIIDKLEVLIK